MSTQDIFKEVTQKYLGESEELEIIEDQI